jgi:autotransporter-associated beta strand protein
VPNLKPNRYFSLLLISGAIITLCPNLGAVTTWTFEWGTHLGEDPGGGSYMPTAPIGAHTSPLTSVMQYLYDIEGTKLATSGSGNSYTGDLIELGFFDTDGTLDGDSYTPNEDHTDMFKGVWTPLTSKTKIGRDWDATTVNAGEFYFRTKFSLDPNIPTASRNNYSLSNEADGNPLDNDYLGDNTNNPNAYENRLNAITNDTLIGIRFYDNTAASSGVARYNTIMDSAWDFAGGGDNLSLHESDGTDTRSTLAFEFVNTSANSAVKVGTSDTTVNGLTEGDFVATVTYFDGDEEIDVGNGGIGSSVFSGFDGTGLIYGGQDANIVTLHSQSGNTGAAAYDFNGSFYLADDSTDSTDLTIIKTGDGDQILSGNINLADSTNDAVMSAGLNIASGNLILKPASGTPNKQQTVEYLTGSGTLSLDNTGVSTDTIVTLGFTNTHDNSISSTFSGNVVLSGGNTAHKIKIASGASDYNRTQIISGTITGDHAGKTLVKDGAGILALHGDSASTMDGGIEIQDGTLLIGDGSDAGADPGDGTTITITKGKLEIAASETIDNTINTDNSNKSILGGEGTYDGAVTVGEDGTNFIDVISPGSGISSSLSNPESQQQISLGDRTNAIGTFTISDTLTLASGGVYDWEIRDFTNAGDDTKAGVDWDLLKFNTLTYNPNDSFTINIMGLSSDGSAGPMAGDAGNVWGTYLQEGGASNGFKFMEFTGSKNWGSEPAEAGVLSNFTIQDSGWKYYNTHHLNQWSVYWDGTSSFYLQYSAVPEPSTYMMVTGLLMVPGMSYLRRIRRKKDSDQEETSL